MRDVNLRLHEQTNLAIRVFHDLITTIQSDCDLSRLARVNKINEM